MITRFNRIVHEIRLTDLKDIHDVLKKIKGGKNSLMDTVKNIHEVKKCS
jgi:hypothetical protein